MKWMIVLMCAMVVQLQFRLWNNHGSLQKIETYQLYIDELQQHVDAKRERNEALYAEVLDLRRGKEALEERARQDLGMIREGETFFQVIE